MIEKKIYRTAHIYITAFHAHFVRRECHVRRECRATSSAKVRNSLISFSTVYTELSAPKRMILTVDTGRVENSKVGRFHHKQ